MLVLLRPLRDRMPGLQTVKAVVAAVISFVVAAILTSGSKTLVAPLTALLVTQVTVYETLTSGGRRVIAVVVGVLVAVVVSHFVVLHWWSLALVLAVAFLIGALLRLEDHSTEVAISAMLLFAVQGSHATASNRISETLIGAAVGVVFSFVVAPLHIQPAGAAIRSLAERTAEVLQATAVDVRGEWSHDLARRALSDARRLHRDIDRAEAAVAKAERSLRLNPRGGRFRATAPSWRAALAALEHVVVSVREIARVLAERTEGKDDAGEAPDREVLASLLGDLAAAVRTFGDVAVGDAAGATGHDEQLRAALEQARQTRGQLTEVLEIDVRGAPHAWALHGALMQAVGRILRELDLETGPDARHVRRPVRSPSRRAATAAATVRAARNASRALAANRLPSRTLAMAARAKRSRSRQPPVDERR
jgi:hypothetical protein